MDKNILQQLEDQLANVTRGYSPAGLYDPIDYTLALGGKRIRPRLVMMGCELFGGNPEKAIRPAIAIELFHNFTLLHDDIMDKAPMRRGKETVYRKWNENTAILSGDTLFALAYDCLSDVNPIILPAVLKLFTATAREVCEGQQYDMDFESLPETTIAEYLEMIRLKTAVLLGCSLKLGALVAGAPAAEADNSYDFGQYLGLAFQLQDDLLDTYGDPGTFGKEIGGDILCGKKTYLYIQAKEKADKETRDLLVKIYEDSKAPGNEKIRKVKAIFHELEVEGMTREKINFYYDLAMKELEDINVPPEKKKELEALGGNLLNRVF